MWWFLTRNEVIVGVHFFNVEPLFIYAHIFGNAVKSLHPRFYEWKSKSKAVFLVNASEKRYHWQLHWNVYEVIQFVSSVPKSTWESLWQLKMSTGFFAEKWHMSYGFLHIFIVVIYFSTWIYIILFWVIQLHVWIDDNRYWFYLNPFGIGTFEWKTFHRILYISFL